MDLSFVIIILVFVSIYGKDANCGIPIFQWNLVYFIILAARSLSHLFKIFLIRHRPQILGKYSLITFLIIDGTFLAWLIYGNVIFYSHDNNCDKHDSSHSLWTIMLVLIIIGYLQMLYYGLLILFLPCLIYLIYTN